MFHSLIHEANRYTQLGYRVGLSKGKSLVAKYVVGMASTTPFDGISILLSSGLVCVDFDTHHSMDLGWGYHLPPTLKEKSPRGYHLFYQLPAAGPDEIRESKIKWKEHVDLLTEGKRVRYGRSQADAHVLCSPTPGYSRIYPESLPPINQVTMAPSWLVDAIQA